MSRISYGRTFALMAGAIGMVSCTDGTTSPLISPPSTVATSRGVKAIVAPASLGWQEQARALVSANNLSPLAAARVYAALSVAQYHAVEAIDDTDGHGHRPKHGVGRGGRKALEAHRGAVAGASAQVLSFFFPAAAPSLEQRVVSEGDATPGKKVHPQFKRGLAIGRKTGDAQIVRVKNDHFTAPWTGTVPVGPGMWIANGPPAGPTFGGVTPYFLTSGSQFRPAPPPAFGSAAFVADRNEIRTLSDTRTPAQNAIALFWNFGTGTFTPPGYWNLVASNYIAANALNERAATRAFALTHAAMMDALIGCWDAKYFYWLLRPSQADPLITLSFALPNHPSYPSGHSCASAAAGTVLSSLFPDRTGELNAQVTEAGLSRMYAGIHYRFDITAGQELGQAVGAWALAHARVLD